MELTMFPDLAFRLMVWCYGGLKRKYKEKAKVEV